MLLTKNKFAKVNNKYFCDMCHTEINSLNRVVISKAENFENLKKKWDLCKKCYKKVERAVERWYEKNNKSY